MYTRKRTSTLVVIFLLLLWGVVLGTCFPTSSKADQLPDAPPVTDTPMVTDTPAVTDPCFQQDIECYGPPPELVECDNNEFTYKNPDGTWTCPDEVVIPPGVRPGHDQISDGADEPNVTQLPEEVIGRRIDCPDGTVGRVIDAQLHTSCDAVETNLSAASATREPISFEQSLLYGAIAVVIVIAVTGAGYLLYRKLSA